MHAQHVPIEHTHKLSTQVTARRERVFFFVPIIFLILSKRSISSVDTTSKLFLFRAPIDILFPITRWIVGWAPLLYWRPHFTTPPYRSHFRSNFDCEQMLQIWMYIEQNVALAAEAVSIVFYRWNMKGGSETLRASW